MKHQLVGEKQQLSSSHQELYMLYCVLRFLFNVVVVVVVAVVLVVAVVVVVVVVSRCPTE